MGHSSQLVSIPMVKVLVYRLLEDWVWRWGSDCMKKCAAKVSASWNNPPMNNYGNNDIKTHSELLAIHKGNTLSLVDFPHKGPVTRNFDIFFCVSLNKPLNKESSAGDWRYHDARVMSLMENTHNGVNKWKCFPRWWFFVRGIHRWPVNSPHKGQWRGSLMFSLICARTNDWVTNRDAGDLRRHRAHYDVIVMNGPVAYITTFYCGNAAKTVTLRTMWWKTLIALATKMHVSKFQ